MTLAYAQLKFYVAQSVEYDNAVLWLQGLRNFDQYADSDVLNLAVSGAKIRNLTRQATNLVNQLRELNDVCTVMYITNQYYNVS